MDAFRKNWKELGISIVLASLIVLETFVRIYAYEAAHPRPSLKELCRNAQQELNDTALGKYSGTSIFKVERVMENFKCPLYCPYIRINGVVE